MGIEDVGVLTDEGWKTEVKMISDKYFVEIFESLAPFVASLGPPVNVTELMVRSVQSSIIILEEAIDSLTYVSTAHLILIDVPNKWHFATRKIVH